jgi:hypothetical protein
LRARRVANGRDWIELAVADTGIGMTPEQQAKDGSAMSDLISIYPLAKVPFPQRLLTYQ